MKLVAKRLHKQYITPDSLVLSADAGARGTDLTGRTLEFGVVAFADSALARTAAVTDLPVLGKAVGSVQGAVAGAAGVVGVTDALPAFAAAVSWKSTGDGKRVSTEFTVKK